MLAGGSAVIATPSLAQARFPSRPIRLIVPWLAGAAADTELRALAQVASAHFGESIVVENKAGASGTLGAQMLSAEAKGDGYMLTQMHPSVFRVSAMLDAPTYNVLADFSWIIQLVGYSYGLVVRADAPWQTFDEFIAYAKANPEKVTYGTAGVGTTQHIAMAQVGELLGIKWLHVPFRGGGDDVQALLGGQIMAVASSTLWGELVQAGKLRLLVTFGPQRIKRFSQAPTLRECGVNVAHTAPYGLVAPKNLDSDRMRTLHDAFRQALLSPQHLEVIARLDMPVQYLDSADYEVNGKRLFHQEVDEMRKLGLSKN